MTTKRLRHTVFAAVILLLLFQNSPLCSAQTKDAGSLAGRYIKPEEQLEFADQLFENGDYEKAAVEYHRYISFFPDGKQTVNARYGMGKSYFAAGKNDQAKKVFHEIISISGKSPQAYPAYFDLSRCFLNSGDPDAAVSALAKLATQTDDQDIIDRVWYDIGWIHLENSSRTAAVEWDKAGTFFDNIRNKSRYDIESLLGRIEEGRDMPLKNPRLSGILSIIPGGGYAYCGRYQDALTAFLLNGGLILAAITAFEDDNPALGGVIAFVEAGFYAGNIYGGITSAHKYNRDKIRMFIRNLKETSRLSLSADGNGKRIGVMFEKQF